MLKINVVYNNHNMQSDVLAPIDAADQSYRVVWSRQVQPGFDAVVYFNHYAYKKRLHDRLSPDSLKILYMYEPVAVDPVQYTSSQWRKYDAILTWNTYLTHNSEAFEWQSGIYFDLPYSTDPPEYIQRMLHKKGLEGQYHISYGIPILEDSEEKLIARKKAICQICGDKFSLITEEIYSLRRDIASWFYKHGKMQMDVYGIPPMNVQNYCGVCDDKSDLLSRYRYALCFENTHHPIWTKGYLTEKLFDCMSAGTIPVYLGASNIQELVPADCYIDYRQYSSLSDLESNLLNMSDETYLGYVTRMRTFLTEYDPRTRHSAYRLYEAVVSMCNKKLRVRYSYPRDYLDSCSFSSRLRYGITRLLLPYHSIIYPMFSRIRLMSFSKAKNDRHHL